jgi:hypothetical protein
VEAAIGIQALIQVLQVGQVVARAPTTQTQQIFRTALLGRGMAAACPVPPATAVLVAAVVPVAWVRTAAQQHRQTINAVAPIPVQTQRSVEMVE